MVANVVSAALKELSAGHERASSAQPSVVSVVGVPLYHKDSDTARESYLQVIDNKDAREWWSTYVDARVASCEPPRPPLSLSLSLSPPRLRVGRSPRSPHAM